MMAVERGSWEPSIPQQLLVSARRVAAELDIPIWKANELCWCLDRYFYAPAQAHYRVSRRSLEEFKELLDQGMSFTQARGAMWNRSHARHQRRVERPYSAQALWLMRRRGVRRRAM